MSEIKEHMKKVIRNVEQVNNLGVQLVNAVQKSNRKELYYNIYDEEDRENYKEIDYLEEIIRENKEKGDLF